MKADITRYPIEQALNSSSCAVVIADASEKDFPLIYVNKAFEEITGYSAEETVGRNCRFLQKEDTEQPGVQELRKAIRNHEACRTILRNYRKDGKLFWNELRISPVFNSEKKLTHYIGVQTDVTKEREASEELEQYRKHLEALVEQRTAQVNEKNSALKEIVGQLEYEKNQFKENILKNTDELIIPLIKKLKRRLRLPEDQKVLDLIERNIADLTDSFGNRISRKMYALSPREIEICNMIRSGMSSKDMADTLHTSLSTIENQRNVIRKKLGISTKKVNLTTFLQQINNT